MTRLNNLFRILIPMLIIVTLWPKETDASEKSPVVPAEIAFKVASQVLAATESEGDRGDLILVLADEADLSMAYSLPTKQERGRFVYDTLWKTAQESQAPIKEWLDGQNIDYQSFYIVNLILVRDGDREMVETMARRPDIARIEANPSIRNPLPETLTIDRTRSPDSIEPNISFVGAPEVWAMGYTGQNVVVGGQDTGYVWDHEALKDKYRGWNGVTANHDYNWHDAIHSGGGSCGANSLVPCDDGSHGTHTMGIVLGDDNDIHRIGMAPGAQWIGCRNMNQGVGTPATYLECFEFFLAPYPVGGNPSQGNPDLAPDVTNNSWSCPTSEGCSYNTLKGAVEAQRAAGIMTVVSAGNNGSSCYTVNRPPAIYDASYTVGATYIDNSLAPFSSRGPVNIDSSYRIKPDIVAPGDSEEIPYTIMSSIPGGYGGKQGTSMAAPHVAGAVVLLWSAVPVLMNDLDATEAFLNDNAVHIDSTACSSSGTPNNLFGWGRLDIEAAVLDALSKLGGLKGSISDEKGAPLGSVQVNALHGEHNFPTTSGTDGKYYLDLITNTYTVTAGLPGYALQSIPAVTVTGQLTTTLNITLDCLNIESANFSYTPTLPASNEIVILTGTIQSGAFPYTCTWDMGDDSSTKTGNPITHTFPPTSSNKTFTVTMSVDNHCHDPFIVQKQVQIAPPGYLTGSVQDKHGAPIQDTKITATLESIGNWITTTNTSGHYQFELHPGDYTVTAMLTDYIPFQKTGVPITSNLTTTLNITLTPMSECVTPTVGAILHSPPQPFYGQPVNFTGTITGGNLPITHTWSMDDGSSPIVGNPIEYSYGFTNAIQTYTVTLSVDNVCPEPPVEITKTIDIRPRKFYLALVLKMP
ncbi:MAG: S8 family serine peptidase [Anaerolineales bacterium]|nr:S8 family serine peptidase [Anaerolineales bacterium]